MPAGDEGVQPLDLVGQPVLHKEIQGTISNGRLGAEALFAQPVKHLIGSECAMFLQEYLKRRAANRGKAQILLGAMCLGGRDRGFHALTVVMGVERDRDWRIATAII